MPPWEKYQSADTQAAGPWSKYQSPKEAAPAKEETLYDPKTGIPYTRTQRQEAATDFGEGIKTGLKETPFWLNDAVNAADTALGAKPPVFGSRDIYKAVGAPITEPKGMGIVGNVLGGAAGMTGVSGAAPKVAESLAAKGTKALPEVKAAAPAAKDIRAEAQVIYKEAEAKGGVLSPKFTDRFLAEAEKAKPQSLQGKAIAGDNPISKLIEKAQAWRGHPMTIQDAQEVDKALTEEISTHFKDGKLDEHGKAIMDFQNKFREMIDTAPAEEVTGGKGGFEALKKARATWSQAARMGDIEKIMQRASSMDNPATAIKTGFRTLANNEKRMRGFTAEEKEAIKKAATSGVATDALRVFGSRLIPIAHVAGGGGPVGALAAHGATSAIRSGATALQEGRAQKVMDMIANRKIPTANEAIGAQENPLGAVEDYYKQNPESASKRWENP